MSEISPEGVIDTPIEPAETTPPDELESQAITTPAGDKLVPLSALQEARGKIRDQAAQVARIPDLETEVATLRELKPFAEFVKNNPHLLQPQAPAAAPPPAPTGPDPELEQYARRFDLYTPAGIPDVERAKAIREDTAKIARTEAEKLFQPMEARGLQQQAAANLHWISQQTDAYGRPLSQDAIAEAVAPLVQGMDEPTRIKAMADPRVAQLLLSHAKTAQLGRMAAPVAAPTTPPLHTETPGGGAPVTLSEQDRRLGARAGLNEQQLRDRAGRFNPRGSNVLE